MPLDQKNATDKKGQPKSVHPGASRFSNRAKASVLSDVRIAWLSAESCSLSLILLLVVSFYFWTAWSNGPYPDNSSNYYYPLLARGFADGHLYLPVRPLPELLALPNPYDPNLNKGLRLHDASLYNGRYYINWGPTPVVLLFAPYYLLTLSDFPQKMAVALFCSLGFLCSARLFQLVIRDHFPGVPLWVLMACIMTLGMADTAPMLIRRPDVYETAISCAYCFLQLGLLCFYLAFRHPKAELRWLLLTSLCLGAAVGGRTTYIWAVVIFVGFLFWMWRQKTIRRQKRPWLPLVALVPVGIIGLLLTVYNYERFDNPFEFGQQYALSGDATAHVSNAGYFRFDNMPYHLWFYFFSPPLLITKFPFIYAIPWYYFKSPHTIRVEMVTGLFVISPVTLLALGLPWVMRKFDQTLVAILLFMAGAGMGLTLFILGFCSVTMRYLFDFAPAFIFLGCVMLCHCYLTITQKHGFKRRLGECLLIAALFLSCWNGLMLSFTGYYDYLRLGSPGAYIALQEFFHPCEIVAQAIANLL